MPILGFGVVAPARPVLGPKSAPPAAGGAQTIVFGAKTRAGAGGIVPAAAAGAATLAKTGGGTAAGEWQVIGTRLAPAQDGGLTSGGTVELVADAGLPGERVFTVTVAAVAGRFDVDSFAEPWPQIDSPELVAAWDAAADGDVIVARDTGATMSATLSVSIVADREAAVRGEAVQVDLEFHTGPRWHLARTAFCKWTFGTDDWTFDAIPADRHVRPGRSALHAYGPWTVTVFEGTAPTQEVGCTVRMLGGRTAAATPRTIAVADPEAVFAGAATVCWSVDGDFAGAPAGARLYGPPGSGAPNEALFHDAMQVAADTAPRGRFLLKRGQTTTLTEATYRTSGVPRSRGFYIDAFGTGAKPVVASGFAAVRQPGDAARALLCELSLAGTTIRNLRLVGRYDPSAPQLLDVDLEVAAVRGATAAPNLPARTTWAHVEMQGIEGYGQVFGGSISVVNCSATDWYSQPLYVDTPTNAAIRVRGCAFWQNPDAAEIPFDGPETAINNGVDPNYSRAGPIRMSSTVRGSIGQCWLSSRNGWGANNGFTSHQPCVRMWSGGAPTRISRNASFVLTGNHLEGGDNTLDLGPAIGSDPSGTPWEMPCLQVSFNVALTVPAPTGGTRTRYFGAGKWAWGAWWNNIVDFRLPLQGGQGIAFIEAGTALLPAGGGGYPVARHTAYANTLIDVRTRVAQTPLAGVAASTAEAVLVAANNLVYVPNQASAVTTWGQPLAATGWKVPFNSPATGGATGLVPPVDYDERVTVVPPTIGAVQAEEEPAAAFSAPTVNLNGTGFARTITAADTSGTALTYFGTVMLPAGQTADARILQWSGDAGSNFCRFDFDDRRLWVRFRPGSTTDVNLFTPNGSLPPYGTFFDFGVSIDTTGTLLPGGETCQIFVNGAKVAATSGGLGSGALFLATARHINRIWNGGGGAPLHTRGIGMIYRQAVNWATAWGDAFPDGIADLSAFPTVGGHAVSDWRQGTATWWNGRTDVVGTGAVLDA